MKNFHWNKWTLWTWVNEWMKDLGNDLDVACLLNSCLGVLNFFYLADVWTPPLIRPTILSCSEYGSISFMADWLWLDLTSLCTSVVNKNMTFTRVHGCTMMLHNICDAAGHSDCISHVHAVVLSSLRGSLHLAQHKE